MKTPALDDCSPRLITRVRSLLRSACSGLFIGLVSILTCYAAGETDPTKVDSDFALQGEYKGEVTIEEGKIPVGAQVIAKGKGKFHLIGYPLGLPGEGWDSTRKHELEATRQGDSVIFQGEELSGTLTSAGIVVTNSSGDKIGELKKIGRKSPTLGAQPPEGAVVLFDEKGINQFPGSKISPEGWLIQGAKSEPTFGDFSLHLEFMLSYAPDRQGQGRSNSGLYLQGRYEVQILDSFGLEGKDNECGGIYSVKAPSINMCLPPLQWQTYDVDFTAARFDEAGMKIEDAKVTVRHNGTLIHKDVKIPKATTAAPLAVGPSPGPIFLQDHGDQVRFRNIWVLPKTSAK